MTGAEQTRYEVRAGAAWITLHRPEVRNALTAVLIRELYEHLEAANADDTVRSIVVTGAGEGFCSGADLKNREPGEGRVVPYPDLLTAIWDSPKPVIAAVNGAAFAGGLGLVAAADIVIAAEEAQFSFSEVRIGVIPAIIAVVCLRKLGPHHGMRLFVTGDRFHVVKRLWGFSTVRYRGLAKNTARVFTAFALANLYLLRRRLLPPRERCLS